MHAPAPSDEGDLPPVERRTGAEGCLPVTRAFIDWVVVVAVALLVAFVVRTFVLAHFVVEGSSMYSTLETGDRVFVNKLSYRLHDPNRGDVVVLHEVTGASERDLIKRVIALPGETVEMTNCQVKVDGQHAHRAVPRPRGRHLEQLRSELRADPRPRRPRVRHG